MTMMNSKFKRWTISVLAFSLAMLILCAGLVTYIDPFFVYHKPISGMYYPYTDIMYQAAGIVKNYDYEVLIAGTSLIQNMKTSTAEKLFDGRVVKTPLCGISFYRIARLITLAAKNNPQLKRVILNMDWNLILSDKEKDDKNFPDFLYDDNYFNDVNYLFNKNIVIKQSIETIINPKNKEQATFDEAFSSESQFYFAEFAVKTHSITKKEPNQKKNNKLLNENIELYRELVANNPDIKFDIIIPPMSVMALKELKENHLVASSVENFIKIVNVLINYQNVSIHMFQDNEDMVGNLYNYCDFQHFSSKVSDDILYAIKYRTDLLTRDNYEEEILKINTMAASFDYSVFSEAAYPIKGETDINRYLDMIASDKKYEIYLSCYDNTGCTFDDDIKKKLLLCGIDIDAVMAVGGDYNQRETNMNNNCIFGVKGEIIINKVDYSMGLPGINIVVYDKELERVIDSSNFNGDNFSECVRTKHVRKEN